MSYRENGAHKANADPASHCGRQKEKILGQIALVRFGEHTEYAIIIGATAYLKDGCKKHVSGSNFEVVRYYKRCPAGHQKEINEIRQWIRRM